MVLVAIIIMTLTTSSYLLLMRNEHLAARYQGNHLQTQQLVDSGIEYLNVFLAQSTTEIGQLGGLLNNPDSLRDVLVVDDALANYRGRFSIVAPDMSQGYYLNLRYGLENESAKLNLNSLLIKDTSASSEDESFESRDRLLAIPGMNDAVADAILDWLDEDDSQRTDGAESPYYQSLTPPYQARNGPFARLDELLMIQGVTPELLYGADVNRNYLADADELPRGELEQLDNSNGQLNRGWSAYLTVHSLEKNATPDGEPKIDLNADILQTLHSSLQQALGVAEANFIIAYRQYGPSGGTVGGDGDGAGAEGGSTKSGNSISGNSGIGSASSGSTEDGSTDAQNVELDFEKEAQTAIDSLLSLVDARVTIEATDGNPAQSITSPWPDTAENYRNAFANLLDLVTIDPSKRVAGRININQASRPVLVTIPGMTETLADQILANRDPAVDLVSGDQRHPTWLIAEGLTTLEELKPLLAYLTTGGDVYSGQVVGYFDAGTARARAEVLLDRSDTAIRLIGWRDISKLGPGFSRTVLSNTDQDVAKETE